MEDFVLDPFSGLPVPDPSGELRRRDFETSPVDMFQNDAAYGTGEDWVLDPITGLPMADPSGELRRRGYETAPLEASGEIFRATGDAVRNAAGSIFTGLKVAIVLTVVAAAVVLTAETRKAFGK